MLVLHRSLEPAGNCGRKRARHSSETGANDLGRVKTQKVEKQRE
jgi:hypothetical protein